MPNDEGHRLFSDMMKDFLTIQNLDSDTTAVLFY